MHTKLSLMNDLKEMGLKNTDALMVHSSMKSIGDVEGRADTVVDAFMEYFKEGLFMTPTHTWKQMSSEYATFDPKTESSCVGIIPNIFQNRPGVVRSLHPTHSIAAYGKDAQTFIQGEENADSPCPKGGCWDRLKDIDAKILLLGVTHARNTYIHSIDEVLDIPGRLTDETTLMHIVMPDGTIKDVNMHRHFCKVLGTGSFSAHFDKMTEIFYVLGAARKVRFGDADCILCEAKKLFEICRKLYEIDPDCVVARDEIPRKWWKEWQAL